MGDNTIVTPGSGTTFSLAAIPTNSLNVFRLSSLDGFITSTGLAGSFKVTCNHPGDRTMMLRIGVSDLVMAGIAGATNAGFDTGVAVPTPMANGSCAVRLIGLSAAGRRHHR